ncbi:hypothetical protein HYU92_04840 [Candidatus Curtissbacteria bacterium]|nr:hypothetical protein [Candidatus Curtissbacteria bacterium]
MNPEFGAIHQLAQERAGQLFSERERQVLQERVDGKTMVQIGLALAITTGTVAKHLQNMSEKTGEFMGDDPEDSVAKHSLLAMVVLVRYKLVDISGLPKSSKDVLTPREQEVVGLLVQGLGAAAIADRLTVTESTVHKHQLNARAKLGIHSVFQLLAWATREELDVQDNSKPVTERQIEVLQRIASGLNLEEIARDLGVARSTVEDHRLNIIKRCGSIAEALEMGARQGWIERSTSNIPHLIPIA